MDVFIHIGRYAPAVFETVQLQDVFVFLTALMGSPSHMKNPYLRGKLAEVHYLPLENNFVFQNFFQLEYALVGL